MKSPIFLATFLIACARALLAQDPALAPHDLAYTREVMNHTAIEADVVLHTGSNASEQFIYRSTPETITLDGKVYARTAKGEWMDRGGDGSGTPQSVASEISDELDTFAQIIRLPFAPNVTHDKRQGAFIWKKVAQTTATNCSLFTYELSREHPRPDGVYPRCTFIKYQGDTDGKLLMVGSEANLINDTGKLFPVTVLYKYPASARQNGEDRPEVWITGDIFTKGGVLFFRADKRVLGNPMGRVVLLGANKATMKVLLPMYLTAAEKHVKLRLCGVLIPFEGTMPGYKGELPSVQFITWKLHAPSDPDDLPPDQRIPIGPDDYMDGYQFKTE